MEGVDYKLPEFKLEEAPYRLPDCYKDGRKLRVTAGDLAGKTGWDVSGHLGLFMIKFTADRQYIPMAFEGDQWIHLVPADQTEGAA